MKSSSLILLIAVLFSQSLNAANETKTVQLDNTSLIIFTIVMGFLLIVIWLLKNLYNGMYREFFGAPKRPVKTGWKKMQESLTKAVPIEKEKDVLLNHNYDGIQELDNSLPPWWLYMFYLTAIFGFVYFIHFAVFETGPSSDEEFRVEMLRAEKEKQEYLSKMANNVDENSITLLNNEADINAGKYIFSQQCTPCHGNAGEGNNVGPNLTDNYWLHGGSIKDIFSTIKYGVPAKGMISWQATLSPPDMAKVASYIYLLRASNPPNAKEAQGDLYIEADTVGTVTTKPVIDAAASVVDE